MRHLPYIRATPNDLFGRLCKPLDYAESKQRLPPDALLDRETVGAEVHIIRRTSLSRRIGREYIRYAYPPRFRREVQVDRHLAAGIVAGGKRMDSKIMLSIPLHQLPAGRS